MAQQQQQQHLPATIAYQNEWPVYPQLKWGHELCPSPHRRPFAPFRNCHKPIPPPRRKTADELAREAREQEWRDRQIYLTNLRGPQLSSSVFSDSRPGSQSDSRSESDSQSQSESDSDQETQEEQEQGQGQQHHSYRLESMVIQSLSATRTFVLKALDVIAALLDWFYHPVIVLAVALLLVSALLDPAKYLFEKFILLFMDDAEPNEFRYVLVQNYRSWSVAQPC
ncbi:uncharacterized protein PG986_009209 [Apiospora aurea]|uniref:Uncharacterized protein n=1 Tax=Apiospora aurea TaxID=335848 RepID=A0ABR1Q754_9PEZI